MDRSKATISLDAELWHRFKVCCAMMKIPPGRGLDSLIEAWLRAMDPDLDRRWSRGRIRP